MDVCKAHRIRGSSRSNRHRRLKLYMQKYLRSLQNNNLLEPNVAVPSTGTERLAIVPNDIHIPPTDFVDVADIQVSSASDYPPPRCAFSDTNIDIVHHSWVRMNELVAWPKPTKHGIVSLVKNKNPVPNNHTLHRVKFHKSAEKYDDALGFLKMLQEHTELPSTDATTPMDNFGQWKRQPKVFSDYTDEKENTPPKCKLSLDIDHSPPPPVLEDMSIDLETSPMANSSWMPNGNVSFNATVSPIAGCSRRRFASWTQKHMTIDKGDGGDMLFKACSSPITSGASIPSTSKTRGNMLVHRSSSPIAGSAMIPSTLSAQIAQMRIEMAQGFQKLLDALDSQTKAINALRHTIVAQHNMLEMQLPVSFPMRTIEQWNLLSSRLYEDDTMNTRLISHINITGGNSFGECTRNILRCLIADELTPHINWRGTNNKVPIGANPITKAIIKSVMLHKFPGATRSGIEKQIQQWIQKSRRRVDSQENVAVVVSDNM